MSDGIYKIITCDRCGFELRIPKYEADQMTARLPDNWGSAEGKAQENDLCPTCFEKYKRLSRDFMQYTKRIDEIQIERMTEEEFDTILAKVLVGEWKGAENES